MARRKREAEEPEDQEQMVRRESVRRALRFAGWTLALVGVVFATALVIFAGEDFVSKDKRFAVAGRGVSASDEGVTVSGVRNASKAAILRIFDGDRGLSLGDLDLERRRAEVKMVDWVREASVRRVWPNRIHVEVMERTPVAFVQVPAGVSGDFNEPLRFRPMMIDEDGVLLTPKGGAPARLVLLAGVKERDDVERRRMRVQLMMRVLDELREMRNNVGEVDVTDPENVRVLYQVQDQQVMLVLGDERFRQRLEIFLRHFEGIRDRLPQRAVLDVSLEGRITAVQQRNGEAAR